MVDWKKKIVKSVGGDLQADEQLEAGLFVQPGGVAGATMGRQLGGLAGALIVRSAQKKDLEKREIRTDTGLGAQLGTGRHVIGLTSRRFIVWGHSQLSGKPKGLDFSVPLGDLVALGHEKGKLTTKMIFEFADGSGAVVEAANIGNPAHFVEAYQRLAG
jgi:hypothetical protein